MGTRLLIGREKKQSSRTYSIRDERFKLLLQGGGGESLFDLVADPGETRDVAGEKPREAARLRQVLSEFRAAVENQVIAAEYQAGEGSALSALDLRRLEALGYVGLDRRVSDESGQAVILWDRGYRNDGRLVSGFHNAEETGWRWVSKDSSAVLVRPAHASAWKLSGWADLRSMPEGVLELHVKAGEAERKTFTLQVSGAFEVSGKLDERDRSSVNFDIACSSDFSPADAGKADSRRLCFIVNRLELE